MYHHKKSSLFPFLLLVGVVLLFIQAIQPQEKKKKQRVDIDNADLIVYDEQINANARRMLGNVSFRRDGAMMFCDSAYSYNDSNKFDTFGHVHVIQGDTLHLYGDKMNYNGVTKLARFVNNVKLIDKSITLTTEALDFDINSNIGYYNHGGKIIDTANVLTSVIGRYYSNDNMMFFKDSVVLTNKDFVLRADTLKYNSKTERAFIVGPTTISGTKKDGVLYSERGWYDTKKNLAELYKASKITTKAQILEADTLFYDRASGNGRGKHRVTLTDTTNKIVIKGKIGVYNENTKFAFVTDSAMFIQYGKNDTLYMHADTLQTKPDTTQVNQDIIKPKLNISQRKSGIEKLKPDLSKLIPDSVRVIADSIRDRTDRLKAKADTLKIKADTSIIKQKDDKFFMAYRKVRFHKRDLQGECDSLGYRMRDSTLLMFYDPVLWSEKNQMSAERIQFISKNPDPSIARLENNAFMVMAEDTVKFNQISGKTIIGQIFKNKLRIADVNGNAQSLYYLKDKNKYSGMNRLLSSKIRLNLSVDNQIDSIRFYPKPEGKTIPIKELKPEDIKLDGFWWRESERPIDRFDLYPIDKKRKKNAAPVKRSASGKNMAQ